MIDSSLEERVKLREELDILEESEELYSIKSLRRRDPTPITTMIDEIVHRDLKIVELNKKRERFSNDIYNI